MCFLHKAINSFSHLPILLRRNPGGHRLPSVCEGDDGEGKEVCAVCGTRSHVLVTFPCAVPRLHFTVLGVHMFVFLLQVVVGGHL